MKKSFLNYKRKKIIYGVIYSKNKIVYYFLNKYKYDDITKYKIINIKLKKLNYLYLGEKLVEMGII
jgi:hypothetical protein